jgi:hypothetical protein
LTILSTSITVRGRAAFLGHDEYGQYRRKGDDLLAVFAKPLSRPIPIPTSRVGLTETVSRPAEADEGQVVEGRVTGRELPHGPDDGRSD